MTRTRSIKKFMKFAGVPLAIFIVVLVVPFVNGFYYSFTDWDGFKTTKFIGLTNYTDSFSDPRFWSTLKFTALFVVVSLILVNAVAFGLALIVWSRRETVTRRSNTPIGHGGTPSLREKPAN